MTSWHLCRVLTPVTNCPLQQACKEEYLIEDMKKENSDSSVLPYLLVDLEKKKPYAIKV